MSLISFLRNAINPQVKSQPGTGNGWFGSSGNLGRGIQSPAPINRNPLNLLSLNIGIVATCSNRNSQAVASAIPRLYATRKSGQRFAKYLEARSLTKKELSSLELRWKQLAINEETVEVLSHPLLDLLSEANTEYDGHSLMELTEGYLGLLGYSAWQIEKQGLKVLSIRMLPSEYLNALVDTRGIVAGWQVKQGQNKQVYQSEELIIFKNLIPGAATRVDMLPTVGIYGCGWLEQCLPEAELLRKINRYEQDMMDNNGRPDFAVNYKNGSLEPERRRTLGKMFRGMFTGSRKGEPFIGDSDFSLEPLGFSPRELSYQQGKKDLRLTICNMAGVPVDLIDTANSNRATSLTAFRSYSILTIQPKLRRYEDTLNAQLIPHFDSNLMIKFDDPVPIDEESEREERKLDLETGVLSVNEVRAQRGLPPLPVDLRSSPGKAGPNIKPEGDINAGDK